MNSLPNLFRRCPHRRTLVTTSPGRSATSNLARPPLPSGPASRSPAGDPVRNEMNGENRRRDAVDNAQGVGDRHGGWTERPTRRSSAWAAWRSGPDQLVEDGGAGAGSRQTGENGRRRPSGCEEGQSADNGPEHERGQQHQGCVTRQKVLRSGRLHRGEGRTLRCGTDGFLLVSMAREQAGNRRLSGPLLEQGATVFFRRARSSIDRTRRHARVLREARTTIPGSTDNPRSRRHPVAPATGALLAHGSRRTCCRSSS